jgi:hypothetical protein
MRVLIASTTFDGNVPVSTKDLERYYRTFREILPYIYLGHHVKYPLFLSHFNETKSLYRLSKYTQIPNFVKIRPLEVELFHADGRMDRRADMTKLIVAFRNFTDEKESINMTFINPYPANVENMVSS